MPDLHYLYNSINGGEMSPQLDTRVDNEKYGTGARILENFIVKPYGGIYKRPGTEFITKCIDETKPSKIFGFNRAGTQNSFVVELGHKTLRILAGTGISSQEANTWFPFNNDPTYFPSYYITSDESPHGLNSSLADSFWKNSSGITAMSAGWVTGVAVLSNTGTFYDNRLWVAKINHTTSSLNAPGSGVDWTNTWKQYVYYPGDVIMITPANTGYNNYAFGIGYVCKKQFEKPFPSILYSDWINPPSVSQVLSAMNSLSAYWEQLDSYPIIQFETPYSVDYPNDVNDVQVEQINDQVFFTHPKYAPRVLTRINNGNWSFEPVKFDFAPSLDVDITGNSFQITYDNDAWTWPYAYKVGDRVAVISSASNGSLSSLSAIGIFTCTTAHSSVSALNSEFGKPGQTTGNWKKNWNAGSSIITYKDWAPSTAYAVGEDVWYGSTIYSCIKAHTSDKYEVVATAAGKNDPLAGKTFADTVPGKGKNWQKYWSIGGSSLNIDTIQYRLWSQDPIFTENSVGESWTIRVPLAGYYRKLNLASTAGQTTAGLATILEPTDPIFLQGQFLVSSRWDMDFAPEGNYYLEESIDGINWTEIQIFLVQSKKDNNISFTYEAPAKGAWYRLRGDRFGAAAAANARVLLIEPANSVITIPFLLTQYIDANSCRGIPTFLGNVILPVEVVGISTTYAKPPAFSSINGYPASLTLHESRLWYSGVPNYPTRIWGSCKDDFYNFLTGTKDSDAIDLTVASKNVSRIRWIKSFNRQIVAGTDVEIYTIDAGDSDASITPTTARSRVRLYNGAYGIPPAITTDSLLYVQAGGTKLREFSYSFQSDSFVAPDMTILAEHIGKSGFKSCALMQSPEPILWLTSNDGELKGFSYDRSQNITAWHRHTTGSYRLSGIISEKSYVDGTTYIHEDSFVDVTVVPSPNAYEYSAAAPDDVYFVVSRRNKNGTIYYGIERFNREAFKIIYGDKNAIQWTAPSTIVNPFLDCSFTYPDQISPIPTDGTRGWRALYNDWFKTYTTEYGLHSKGLSGRPVLPVMMTDYSRQTKKAIPTLVRDSSINLGLPPTSVLTTLTIPYSAQYYESYPGINNDVILGGSIFNEYTSAYINPYYNGIVVGIPYMSIYIPTRFDIKLDNGTSMGRKQRINRVQFKLWKSKGGEYIDLNAYRSSLSGGSLFSLEPYYYNSSLSKIAYSDFTFNITPDQNQSATVKYTALSATPESAMIYSGSTTDTTINGSWTENPLFAVVHREPAPFNLLGMVWKMEIEGN